MGRLYIPNGRSKSIKSDQCNLIAEFSSHSTLLRGNILPIIICLVIMQSMVMVKLKTNLHMVMIYKIKELGNCNFFPYSHIRRHTVHRLSLRPIHYSVASLRSLSDSLEFYNNKLSIYPSFFLTLFFSGIISIFSLYTNTRWHLRKIAQINIVTRWNHFLVSYFGPI